MNQYFQKNCKKPYVGIIILDTKFQRILGDIGNPKTWYFPVIYSLMKGKCPDKVVNYMDYEVLSTAISAAKDLEKKGVDAITTTCGFLAKYQKEISNSVNIPVFTSSLLQIPVVHQLLNRGKIIGIITANSKFLTKEHLSGVNVKNIPLFVIGMENKKYFQKVFIENRLFHFDRERIKTEMIEIAKEIKSSCPELGAIILECTNMSPYAYDVQRTLGLPVFDMWSLMLWAYSGLFKNIFSE